MPDLDDDHLYSPHAAPAGSAAGMGEIDTPESVRARRVEAADRLIAAARELREGPDDPERGNDLIDLIDVAFHDLESAWLCEVALRDASEETLP